MPFRIMVGMQFETLSFKMIKASNIRHPVSALEEQSFMGFKTVILTELITSDLSPLN